MVQKSRKLEEVAEKAISLLHREPLGLRTRELARRLEESPSTVRRAVLLAAATHPSDYEMYGSASLQNPPVEDLLHAREGVLRYQSSYGGIYWWKHEEALAAGIVSKGDQYWGWLTHNRLLAVSNQTFTHPRLFRLLHVYPALLFWRYLARRGFPVPPRLDARTVDGLLQSHLHMIRLLETDPEFRGSLTLYRFGVAVFLWKAGFRAEDPVAALPSMLRAREKVWNQP